MTTQKRCEVCGKEKCQDGQRYFGCGAFPTSVHGQENCHGTCSPPPRSDEVEKEMPVPNDRCRVCYAYPHRGEAHHPECMFKPPSEWEKDFEEGGKFEHIHCSIKYDGEHECADHDCVTVALIPYIRSLLLSYGKEREKEMWRKCMEAVRCHDISAYVGSEVVDLHNDILSALDALNPDNSSPDEGREG